MKNEMGDITVVKLMWHFDKCSRPLFFKTSLKTASECRLKVRLKTSKEMVELDQILSWMMNHHQKKSYKEYSIMGWSKHPAGERHYIRSGIQIAAEGERLCESAGGSFGGAPEHTSTLCVDETSPKLCGYIQRGHWDTWKTVQNDEEMSIKR